MKTSKNYLLLFCCLMTIASFGQVNIHLHTNKDGYTVGESVWFSAYMADSLSGRLRQNAEPMFVQLFAPDGKKTPSRLYLCKADVVLVHSN